MSRRPFPPADPGELRYAALRGIAPHQYRYISSVGHDTPPEDATDPVRCCTYPQTHSVHRRVISCGEGWCVHRDGAHVQGPYISEAAAVHALHALQPMSADWAVKYEGWQLRPPVPCDLCTVIRRTPAACPGVLRHCADGEHCVSTGADCAGAANLGDHPSHCELCGVPIHGLSLVDA